MPPLPRFRHSAEANFGYSPDNWKYEAQRRLVAVDAPDDRLNHPVTIALRRRYSSHRRRAAVAILALPSGVLAPVDIPPWYLQRPFGSAWH